MKKQIGNILALVALAALAIGGWTAWQAWQLRQARNALTEIVQSPAIDALIHGVRPQENATQPEPTLAVPPRDNAAGGTPTAEEQVDLALRGVLLSQGEGGVETWRLRASWATLRQDSGKVETRAPHILYALGEPEQTVDGSPFFTDDQYADVTSLTGLVEDNNTRITMEGDVRAVYQGEVLTGPVAVFYNDERVLIFPSGAELTGPKLSGKAGVLRWNLSTNILEGENRVEVIWTPPADPASNSAASAPDKTDAAKEPAPRPS